MTTPTSLYAVWYDRLIAYMIDMVVVAFPGALVLSFVGTIDADGKLTLAPESVLIVFLLKMAYFVAFLSSRWQATPGMRVMALHLIRTDGRAISQRDALERYLALVIPMLPLDSTLLPNGVAGALAGFMLVLWFSPLFTTRVGLHDKWCGMRMLNGRIG